MVGVAALIGTTAGLAAAMKQSGVQMIGSAPRARVGDHLPTPPAHQPTVAPTSPSAAADRTAATPRPSSAANGSTSPAGPATEDASQPAEDTNQPTVAVPRPKIPTGNRFVRPTTRFGDADTSPYHIDHVRELQYRLGWAGVYDEPVDGTFGPLTRAAVKRFQRSVGLPVTGVADRATWAVLLQRTVRRPQAVPAVCRSAGWHACYDRTAHQVTLWQGGRIVNTWLVRGGRDTMRTELGTHPVYLRNIDQVSTIYDNAPMPYSQFFFGGQALHGAANMVDPFEGHSHGCINMYIEDAHQLWDLTYDKPLSVTVYGAWS